MPTNASNANYSSIPEPYDSLMSRSNTLFGVAQLANNNALSMQIQTEASTNSQNSNTGSNLVSGSALANDPTDVGGSTVTSQTLDNLTISSWIKSRSYTPKKSGFYMNGGTGYAEFTNVYISGTIAAVNGTLGTITSGQINLDTQGYIAGGATDYLTGVGFFLGFSSGAYKFSVGNPATDYVAWDGTGLHLKGIMTMDTVGKNIDTGFQGAKGIGTNGGGGRLIFVAGDGSAVGTSADGGKVSLHSGNATNGDGGDFFMVSGRTSQVGSATGTIQIRTEETTVDSGGAGNNSVPGDVEIVLGKSPDGTVGHAKIKNGVLIDNTHHWLIFDVVSIQTSDKTVTWPNITGIVNISTSGGGAPGTTPPAVGLTYCDTTGGKVYISTGTTNSGDWKLLN